MAFYFNVAEFALLSCLLEISVEKPGRLSSHANFDATALGGREADLRAFFCAVCANTSTRFPSGSNFDLLIAPIVAVNSKKHRFLGCFIRHHNKLDGSFDVTEPPSHLFEGPVRLTISQFFRCGEENAILGLRPVLRIIQFFVIGFRDRF